MKNKVFPFQKAPKCTATSKRTKERCRAPAVRGFKVCRFHGARGGAPCGQAHGNYTTGEHTKEANRERREVSQLLRESHQLLNRLDGK